MSGTVRNSRNITHTLNLPVNRHKVAMHIKDMGRRFQMCTQCLLESTDKGHRHFQRTSILGSVGRQDALEEMELQTGLEGFSTVEGETSSP